MRKRLTAIDYFAYVMVGLLGVQLMVMGGILWIKLVGLVMFLTIIWQLINDM